MNALTTEDESTEFRTASPKTERGQTRICMVLAAFNEEEALGPLLEAISETLDDDRIDYRVIIVDDGSKDATASIAAQASFRMPVTVVEHRVNKGLAAALRTGFTAAMQDCEAGDIVITMDADNTHPPGLMHRMSQLVAEGHDVVIASRYQHGAQVIGVPTHRNLLSLGARAMFRVCFPIRGVRDYTCGFRAYRSEVLRSAMEDHGDRFISETGFSCMVDVLLKLRQYPLVFGEVPMILRYDLKGGVSKMRVARTVWQTMKLIARRRFGGG